MVHITDDRFISWLHHQAEHEVNVHSEYERVINLSGENGTLYTLQQEGLPMQPATLQLPEASFRAVKDAIIKPSKTINIQCLKTVDLKRMSLKWTSEKVLSGIPEKIGVLKESLNRSGVSGGMLYAILPSEGVKPTVMERYLAKALEKSLFTGDYTPLIGLGIGLTPSGDDAVCGLLAVQHVNGDVDGRGAEQIQEALCNTTAVSKTMLHYALKGEFNESLLQLMIALTEDDEKQLKDRAEAVCRYGSTSGTDTLAGVISGLNSLVPFTQNEEERPWQNELTSKRTPISIPSP